MAIGIAEATSTIFRGTLRWVTWANAAVSTTRAIRKRSPLQTSPTWRVSGGSGERGRKHLDLQRHRRHDGRRQRRHEQKEADWEGRGPQASPTEAPHDESGDDHGHR